MLESASGGGLLPGGSGLGEGGVCSGGCRVWGVSGPGVFCQHALRQTPLPVNRMTNRCKNITLATTSLRPVTKFHAPSVPK